MGGKKLSEALKTFILIKNTSILHYYGFLFIIFNGDKLWFYIF